MEFEEGIVWITGNGKNNLKIKKNLKSQYVLNAAEKKRKNERKRTMNR